MKFRICISMLILLMLFCFASCRQTVLFPLPAPDDDEAENTASLIVASTPYGKIVNEAINGLNPDHVKAVTKEYVSGSASSSCSLRSASEPMALRMAIEVADYPIGDGLAVSHGSFSVVLNGSAQGISSVSDQFTATDLIITEGSFRYSGSELTESAVYNVTAPAEATIVIVTDEDGSVKETAGAVTVKASELTGNVTVIINGETLDVDISDAAADEMEDNPYEIVSAAVEEGRYVIAEGNGIPLSLSYRNGETLDLIVPSLSVLLEEGFTGGTTAILDYAGQSVPVDVFVPSCDSALIDNETKLLAFISGNAKDDEDNVLKEAIITGSFTANLNGEGGAYVNAGSALYSTSISNEVTVTGDISGQARFYVSASDVLIEGFTLIDGSSDSIKRNVMKISNKDYPVTDAYHRLENVVISDMRLVPATKGLDINGVVDCTVTGCTITATSGFNAPMGIRRATGLDIIDCSSEGKGLTKAIVFNDEDGDSHWSTDVVFRNLSGFTSIRATENSELTIIGNEYTQSGNLYNLIYSD